MSDQDPQYQQLLEQLAAAATAARAGLLAELHERYRQLQRGGTTPTHQLPYPDPDDPISEGAAAIRLLAELVDQALSGVQTTAAGIAVSLAALQGTVSGLSTTIGAASATAQPGVLLVGGTGGRINVGDPLTPDNAVTLRAMTAAIAAIPTPPTPPASNLANGPTTAAYNRNATGSGFFTTWMNAQNQFMRNTSSLRYKEDIHEPVGLDDAVQLLLAGAVRWRQYHRIGQPDGTVELGLIAEEVADVGIPHLVAWDQTHDPDTGEVIDDEWRPEAVRYETVLPVYLLEMVQRLYADNQALTARVAALEAR